MGIDRGTKKAPSPPSLTTFASCDNGAVRFVTLAVSDAPAADASSTSTYAYGRELPAT
jgi:hypothetical protein